MDGIVLKYTSPDKTGKLTVTANLPDGSTYTDQVNVMTANGRRSFTKDLCGGRDGIDPAVVNQQLEEVAAEIVRNKENPPVDTGATPDVTELLAGMPEDVKAEAESLLKDVNLIKHVINDAEALGVAGEQILAATLYLAGVSRLLDRPLAVIVQGPSSSGKSFVIERVARMFPPEAVILATQMTPRALFHMSPGSLKHRFIVAGERSRISGDENAEATRALREMLSSGRLSKLMPFKGGNGIETRLIEQDGPIAYVESTTSHKLFEEDANRCILMNTDERSEQTRRVIDSLAERYAGQKNGSTAERVVQRHHAIQRMLRSTPTVIPYAGRLSELFGVERVEARRAFTQLLSMIQAVTLLYQRQRAIDLCGRLIATADDYVLARYLLRRPMMRLLGGGVSDGARRFYDRLRKSSVDTFTTQDAIACETSSRSSVYGWLGELRDHGLVKMVGESRGRSPAVWRLSNHGPMDSAELVLPTVEQVFPGIGRTSECKLQSVIN